MQIELKFRIAPDELPALRRYPPLRQIAASPKRAERHSGTYFDTPDFLLRKSGLALQILPANKTWRQSLSSFGSNAALPFACEWETDILEPKVDDTALTTWLMHEARFKHSLVKELKPSDIVPIFTLDCRRTRWRPIFADGQEAELLLDDGSVRIDATQQAIAELTLTHHSGKPGAFYEFALALQQDFKLRPVCRNWLQSGYALRDLTSAPPVTARHLVLPIDADAAQGMQIIVRDCLSQIGGNAAGVVYGTNIESVHQMRVGLRRLRSALEIFAPLIPCPVAIQAELSWLASELGDARDWDVLHAVTIPALTSCCHDVGGLIALQTQVHREAIDRHRNAALAVDSARSARLWLMLDQWLSTIRGFAEDDTSSDVVQSISLMQFAAEHVRRFHKKALKRCGCMDIAVAESRHRVRIASKRLRYATEFFASYYPRKSASRMMAGLAELQDALGASNDTAVADGLLVKLAREHPDLSEICAYIRGYQAAIDDGRLVELGKRIRRFSALKKLHLRATA